MTDKTPKDVLTEAIRLLEPRGAWIRGALHEERPDGGNAYCVWGAFHQACHGNADQKHDGLVGATCEATADLLATRINSENVAQWNDTRQSKTEVIKVLRGLEKSL